MNKKIIFSTFLLTFLFVQATFAENITLTKNEVLIPQGWSVADDDLKFKKNTVAELNSQGELITGTLNQNTYLRPTGWKNLINDYAYLETNNVFFPRFFRPINIRNGFAVPTYGHVRYKDNTQVTFAPDGTVLSGTISEKVSLKLQPKSYGFVDFKSDTELTFYPDGQIKSGTLATDTKLRPLGWKHIQGTKTLPGFLEFKSGTKIEFEHNGYVTQGTLKENATWKTTTGKTIDLPAKKTIQFMGEEINIYEEKM